MCDVHADVRRHADRTTAHRRDRRRPAFDLTRLDFLCARSRRTVPGFGARAEFRGIGVNSPARVHRVQISGPEMTRFSIQENRSDFRVGADSLPCRGPRPAISGRAGSVTGLIDLRARTRSCTSRSRRGCTSALVASAKRRHRRKASAGKRRASRESGESRHRYGFRRRAGSDRQLSAGSELESVAGDDAGAHATGR